MGLAWLQAMRGLECASGRALKLCAVSELCNYLSILALAYAMQQCEHAAAEAVPSQARPPPVPICPISEKPSSQNMLQANLITPRPCHSRSVAVLLSTAARGVALRPGPFSLSMRCQFLPYTHIPPPP